MPRDYCAQFVIGSLARGKRGLRELAALAWVL